MTNISINGLPVIEARLEMPRVGAWTADVVVDAVSAAQLTAGTAATLQTASGALSYLGTVYQSDSYAQSVTLRLVGGTNGLAKLCTARFYAGVTCQTPLNDLLSDSGETLSPIADQVALGVTLTFWSMVAQSVGLALSNLAMASSVGAVWRILPDGSVFFGVDGFPATGLGDYQLIDYVAQEKVQIISAEVPNVNPGESFNGNNVSVVEHRFSGKGSRARIWFE